MEQREIKFRAWHTDRMIPWVENLENGIGGVRMYFSLMIVDKDVVLMQYTGLKDKNGKDIYEEDIVSSPRHKGLGKICWVDAQFMAFSIEQKDKWLSEILSENSGASEEDEVDCDELTIIGNIYENTELLEKNKE